MFIDISALAFGLVTFQALAFWVMVFWLLAFQLWRFVRIPADNDNHCFVLLAASIYSDYNPLVSVCISLYHHLCSDVSLSATDTAGKRFIYK